MYLVNIKLNWVNDVIIKWGILELFLGNIVSCFNCGNWVYCGNERLYFGNFVYDC